MDTRYEKPTGCCCLFIHRQRLISGSIIGRHRTKQDIGGYILSRECDVKGREKVERPGTAKLTRKIILLRARFIDVCMSGVSLAVMLSASQNRP